MKVTIIADFQDDSCKDHFINAIMAMAQLSSVAVTVDEPACEPALSLDKPEDIPAVPAMDMPPAEEPAITMAVELPPEPPIVAPEVPPMEPVEPAAEPEQTNEPAIQEQGAHTIVSLSTTYEVNTVFDPSTKNSRLEVGSSGVNGTSVDFWYNGVEFFMPAADESVKASVVNPEHDIKTNTIRVVVSKPGAEGTFALLVDVETPDASNFTQERLVIGSDSGY